MSGTNVPIGEVAEVFNGKTPSKKDKRSSGHPVLKVKDVRPDRRFSGEFDNFVDTDFALKYPSKWINENDILILNSAHSASHVGSKLYFAEKEVERSLPVGEWTIVRPNRDRIEPALIYWWLNSDAGRSALRGAVTGLHLYPKDVAELPVPLPLLDEQQRIVGILNRAAKIEQLRAQAQDRLREFVPALFVRMFGDPVENPMGWGIESLAQLAHEFRYGTSRKCLSEPRNGDIPILRIPNVLGNAINWHDIKFTSLTERETETLLLEQGDLLFVRTNGNPDYVGRCAVFTDGRKAAYASYLIRLRLASSARAIPGYVSTCLELPPMRQAILRLARTTAGNYNVNIRSLESLKLPVPPLERQSKFVQILNSVRSAGNVGHSGSESANALTASLMNRLLDIAHDEPNRGSDDDLGI